jgi:hypothetical protein
MPDDQQSTQLFLDSLTFVVERWEFLLGVLLGGGGTYTTITFKKKQKIDITLDGDKNLTTQVIDSPHAEPQTAGRDAVRQEAQNGVLATFHNSPGAVMNVGTLPTVGRPEDVLGPITPQLRVTTVILGPGQEHILGKIQDLLNRLGVTSSFSDRYQSAIGHLNNNNAQVCASEYHSAFLEIVPVLRERETYSTTPPPPENLTAFENSFEQIRIFMNTASHDHVALRAQVTTFENSLIILLGYL